MNSVIGGVLAAGLGLSLASSAGPARQPLPPPFTALDLHGVPPPSQPEPIVGGLPHVVSQGDADAPANADQRQVKMPDVQTPGKSMTASDGKAGTGFFISDDTLLTAAHVASGCSRMQIISKYVERSWVSPIALDQTHDIAILKAQGVRAPAVVHLAATAPANGKLFIMGYPISTSLTVAAETWAVMENDKFPSPVDQLTDPRDLLWMSAPEVTHGYSGGPIFDPRSGEVVGLVKGEVDGGYLRLVRDMPTTGIAIGPGIASIAALLRREVPYVAVNLAAAPGDAGVEDLRHATVHVLCWQ